MPLKGQGTKDFSMRGGNWLRIEDDQDDRHGADGTDRAKKADRVRELSHAGERRANGASLQVDEGVEWE